MKKRKVLVSTIILSVLAIVSCELDVPVREILDSKLTIDRAKEVQAEKYDKKNLDDAVQELFKSHEFIKQEKADDAKKSAIKSKNLAMAAIKTSLPLLAADTIAEAKKIYSEAEELNGAESAGEELKKADGEIKQAENLNSEKEYWNAYLEAKKAIDSAASARDKALAVIPQLKNRIDTLNSELNILKAHELSSSAEAEINQAKSSVDKASGILESRKLKEINPAIVAAEADIKKAKEKLQAAVDMESQKKSVAEKIKDLNEELTLLKSRRGNDFAPEEISKTDVLLGESNELLAGSKPAEALAKVNEAEALLKSAKEKTDMGLAKEKIISVTKLYDDTKKRDTDNKFSAELTEASAILMSSNQLFEKGSYNESMTKAGEAEQLLKSTSIEIEKYAGSVASGQDMEKEKEKEMTAEGEEEQVIYTVKWRKKNTDCLWRISLNVYKNARLWPYIYRANKGQIKDPDLIFPGQKFLIPSIQKIKNVKTKSETVKEKPLPAESDKKENTDTEKK